MRSYPVSGAGLGLRRGMFPSLRKHSHLVSNSVDFFEVAPENWIGVGGRFGTRFQQYADEFPIVCHGLSLSLGSPQSLDMQFLAQVRDFLRKFQVRCYSDHLSACSDDGHLYDLMPIPFTEEAVEHVVRKIQTVQDFLDQRMAIEHVSYYVAPGQQLREIDFINQVLEGADCNLLLDVNNVYVNSINFGYDPYEFIDGLPLERTVYIHIAGHFVEAEDLRVDTHAAKVIEPVWDLLEYVYTKHGPIPTLLERDFRFPPVPTLLKEVRRIKSMQAKFATTEQ